VGNRAENSRRWKNRSLATEEEAQARKMDGAGSTKIRHIKTFGQRTKNSMGTQAQGFGTGSDWWEVESCEEPRKKIWSKKNPWMATRTREQEMNQLAHSSRNPSANPK
jgi:hypothetical protein